MIYNTKKGNREWREDKIDHYRYYNKGIAELGRAYNDLPQKEKFDHSITQLPIVARGITAFLAHTGMDSYREREHGFNHGIGLKVFFNRYYTHCFKFLRNIDNNRTSYDIERKSDMILAVEHLENEKKILSEPQLFFSEFINNIAIEKEKSVADDIRKAASYYLEWVNEAQIKEIEKEPEIPIPALKDKTELKNKAQDLLVVLSGCWINNEKIMTDDEYKKVVQGIFCLIDSDRVDPIVKKIQSSAPQQFIRRLFWTLHEELYSKKSTHKDCFIDFIIAYFECFINSEKKTIRNNFKEYRNGDFDKDYKKVLESIKK